MRPATDGADAIEELNREPVQKQERRGNIERGKENDDKIILYRNLFTGYSDDSIERVGSYPAPSSWSRGGGRNAGIEFERRVQSWLEGLKNEKTSELTDEAAGAFEQFVIPGLLQGEIHAAGPRLATGITFHQTT